MRAFIALLPPAAITEELDGFLEPRQEALADRAQWRWTRSEQRHLTLAFLPELEEWREEELIAAGEAWAERSRPVQLALRGAGAFPDPGEARVLWAAVAEPDPGSLASWAMALRSLASRSGVRVDGTRFTPHLTLARSAGRPQPAGHLLQALDTLHTSTWRAEEVCLIRSELGQGPGGTPRYTVRHTWSLS